MKELIRATITKLKEAPLAHPSAAFVGFDGYVDKIQFPVQKSEGRNQHFFPNITEFSGHLAKLAEKSGQIELVTRITKPGGNGPLMAAALAGLGHQTTCMGTMGKPEIHPIFRRMQKDCELISLGPPAESHAFEFGDGKLIFSDLSTFTVLNWQFISEQQSLFQQLVAKISDSRLIALVGWVNLPHCTGIWKGVLKEVLPLVPSAERIFFFDLADPGKKSREEILQVLQIIGEYQAYGQVILGMNENETIQIYEVLSGKYTNLQDFDNPLKAAAAKIFKTLSLDILLVHPTDRSLVITTKGTTELSGRLVPHPKVLTGAGDNLNAAFASGLLRNYDMQTNLLLAMAASGAYIAKGSNPITADLIQYLQIWLSELES